MSFPLPRLTRALTRSGIAAGIFVIRRDENRRLDALIGSISRFLLYVRFRGVKRTFPIALQMSARPSDKRIDRMELQHRVGTSHCPCDADSSESRPRYDPDGHWRNGSAGPLC